MAVTDEQYGLMRQWLWRNAKPELKALAALPSKTVQRAAFDVANDFWDANRVQLKADMDAQLGFTTTPALAKAIEDAFFNMKLRS
jgi:hypothetical protein